MASPSGGSRQAPSTPQVMNSVAPPAEEQAGGSTQRVATLVWILQAFLFLGSSVAWFVWPRSFLSGAAGADPVLDATAVRLRAPLALAFAMASAYAAMREDADARRRFARGFAITFLVWGALEGNWLARGHALVLADAALLALPAAANLLFALTLRADPPKWRRLSGSASTLPSSLWLLWLAQGFAFVGAGLLLLFAPEWVVAFTVDDAPSAAAVASAAGHLRFLGPMTLGIGVFSWTAMRAEQEWLWRVYASSTVAFLGAWFVTFIVAWDERYRALAGLVMTLGAGFFLLGNQVLQGPRINAYAEDIGRGPDGWVLMDLLTGPVLAIQSLLSGRRSTHLAGTAARGTFTVVDDLDCPENDFFKAGLTWDVVVRFSNMTWRDHAALDVRGCALRLALPGKVSPFDMGMNTGTVSPVANVVEFGAFALSKWLPPRLAALRLRGDWRLREDALTGMRRAPRCYTTLRYHSQTVRLWVDARDVRHLVRYRLVPDDATAGETGMPDARDYERPWERRRRADETRATDYLSSELQRRLEGSRSVRMRFQAQFHRPHPGDGTTWYNSTVAWPEESHPWRDLAVVQLDAPLTDAEAERLEFNPGNHPHCLGVPLAAGARDYRSLADSERRIIRKLQALRRWRVGSFGLPRFGDRAPKDRP